jgi:hypothetical protein
MSTNRGRGFLRRAVLTVKAYRDMIRNPHQRIPFVLVERDQPQHQSMDS